jgi:hypothetical protein
MRSIEPAVVSTLPQPGGVKAQLHSQTKDPKTAAQASTAAAVQNDSATGGQK